MKSREKVIVNGGSNDIEVTHASVGAETYHGGNSVDSERWDHEDTVPH